MGAGARHQVRPAILYLLNAARRGPLFPWRTVHHHSTDLKLISGLYLCVFRRNLSAGGSAIHCCPAFLAGSQPLQGCDGHVRDLDSVGSRVAREAPWYGPDTKPLHRPWQVPARRAQSHLLSPCSPDRVTNPEGVKHGGKPERQQEKATLQHGVQHGLFSPIARGSYCRPHS